MPYKNKNDTEIFFSGIKSHLSIKSSESIITAGFHRTYLSVILATYLQQH